ncbi:hypothetical protein F4781DRAFT_305771 [Annulohypoxylon bovei var. microspora]|nr:hypothetical protein F4781DRAFT_305771 [Annulohypoxylon bovei var. microspora]
MSSSGNGPLVPEHKLASILKRPLATPEDYEVRVGPGWTLNDGTYDHIPQTKRRKRDVPYPAYVDQSHQSMFGLTTLQLAHDAPVTLCAMDIATEHLWRCLPDDVQELVEVVPPNGPELWGRDEKARDAMYARMAADLDEETNTFKYYSDLKRKPWAIWPLWVEDEFGMDWVVVVSYSQASTGSRDTYDRLRSYAIYDARRDPNVRGGGKVGKASVEDQGILRNRLARIRTRLLEFLQRGGFDTDKAAWSDARMSPMAADEYTSGERCFAAVKDILDCISHNHIEGRGFNPDKERLPSLSRWINPYQSRIEMAGINAWVLMSTFDYNARIAVECIEPEMKTEIVVDGQRRTIKPYALAGPIDPPLVAEPDYLLKDKSSTKNAKKAS